MRTDAAARVKFVAEDAPFAIDAKSPRDRRVAPLEVREERFAAAARPSHRAAEPPGSPQNGDLLRLQIGSRPEGAADIPRHHANLLAAQNLAQQGTEQHRALAAGVQRV